MTQLVEVFLQPVVVTDWWAEIYQQHGDPLLLVGTALVILHKLAPDLSGFETGVAVMPSDWRKAGRYRNPSGGPHPRHQAIVDHGSHHHEHPPHHLESGDESSRVW